MTTLHTSTLDELRGHSLKQVLESVLEEDEILTVRMPSGQEVVIRPRPSLEPLPALEGSVPEGWRDAVWPDEVPVSAEVDADHIFDEVGPWEGESADELRELIHRARKP